MAKAKEPSVDDALVIFKDVMNRSSISNYVHLNGIMIGKNDKDKNVIIVPDKSLWLKISEDEDIKSKLKEIDISDPAESENKLIISYAEVDPKYIDIDIDTLFKGSVIKIKVSDEFTYEIPINKNLLPLKLKKNEFNNIGYWIFNKPSLVLALRKRFDFPIDNYGFSMIRLFKII